MDAHREQQPCPHCKQLVHRNQLKEHISVTHPPRLDVFEASARDSRRTASHVDRTEEEPPALIQCYPLFDATRDGFKTPKTVEAGMRAKYRVYRERLKSALDRFEAVELGAIIPAIRAAKDLTAALQEIIDYRSAEKSKVADREASSNPSSKPKSKKNRRAAGRSVVFVGTGQTRRRTSEPGIASTANRSGPRFRPL